MKASVHTTRDGRQRPLAVTALEDKVVQWATAAIRRLPGVLVRVPSWRGAHDALDALCVGMTSRKVNFILDADIQSFFDTVSQEWLIRVAMSILAEITLERRRGQRG